MVCSLFFSYQFHLPCTALAILDAHVVECRPTAFGHYESHRALFRLNYPESPALYKTSDGIYEVGNLGKYRHLVRVFSMSCGRMNFWQNNPVLFKML